MPRAAEAISLAPVLLVQKEKATTVHSGCGREGKRAYKFGKGPAVQSGVPMAGEQCMRIAKGTTETERCLRRRRGVLWKSV